MGVDVSAMIQADGERPSGGPAGFPLLWLLPVFFDFSLFPLIFSCFPIAARRVELTNKQTGRETHDRVSGEDLDVRCFGVDYSIEQNRHPTGRFHAKTTIGPEWFHQLKSSLVIDFWGSYWLDF
jgi:hypothetical protein